MEITKPESRKQNAEKLHAVSDCGLKEADEDPDKSRNRNISVSFKEG
jgi:hypothetical protein